MKSIILTVVPSEEGMTLLSFLRLHCPDAPSVKAIKRAIDKKSCSVNGRIETFSSHPLKKGDKVRFDLSSLSATAKEEKYQPGILYEDEVLLICNKPAGMVCENRIFNQALPQYLGKLLLVHRLDKETSGVLILAKDGAVLEKMISLFKEHAVRKLYLALVDKTVKKEKGKVDNYLGKKSAYQGQTIYGEVDRKKGQHAITLWKCLKSVKTASLLLAEPVTGRTHQLRVHFSLMGHPILGDAQYGKAFSCKLHPKRHLLHAYSIRFTHPLNKKEIEAIAPIPSDFQEALSQLQIELNSKRV
ncbi:MAG: RluA family pseudouridine synthase [Parachlamydiales bacterium]|nr:RluA family pseudouridine synthase [Candidatus Acheromyda pituitae]